MNHKSTATPARKSRGIAMITVLFIVVIMFILVGALLETMPQELRAVSYTGYDNRALYVADAGVQHMTLSVEEQSQLGLPPLQSLSYSYPPDASGNAAHYDVKLLDSGTSSAGIQYYAIQSDGYSPQGEHRHVNAVLQQGCFCGYDYLGKNNAPGNFFVAGLMQFNGPVYLEGATFANPVNIQWYNNVAPLFLDNVTISGTYKWWDPNFKPNVPPQTRSQWNSVAAQGRSAVSFKPGNAVPFPAEAHSMMLANEAFQGNPGNGTFPAPKDGNGVYINQQDAGKCDDGIRSGIYVQGDANLAMSSTATTQTFSFTSSGLGSIPGPVTITLDFANNVTHVNSAGKNVNCSGLPNGVGPRGQNSANGSVFVNGNIKSLSGTVNGEYTIGVPDTATLSKNVTVTGHIKYQHDPMPPCSCGGSDMLGIVANDVIVSTSPLTPNNLVIEAAVFAGNKTETQNNTPDGTFETDMGTGSGICGQNVLNKGSLTVYGSLVNNYVAPLGCYDPSSGRLTHGYADQYSFDTRLKYNQPPFFPNTNKYNIVAWKDYGNK